ncbi:RDD family protein [Litoreibacter roseus]|uniref:RDD family protein n=1 Tax=Litoreibacter roseus TaxID=2601869 RepID=A0A6N6JKP7_9RHOB|nr:RDD family protein [Litoreibacter roseus]GFE66886.1 RDD family protein [Litoreibacter roseus]
MSSLMTNFDPQTTASTTALPDPVAQPEFYVGVTFKRFLAWIVDVILIGTLSAIVATLPLFIGWFFFPIIYLGIAVVYRVTTISARSATLGMRLFNIELRDHQGARLDGGTAALHTIGYLVASAFFLPQMISLLMMLLGGRGQGLHDLLIGTAAINRPARY